MKHIYFLILLVFACLNASAITNRYDIHQNNWRWRNNDGTEANASWKAAQNKPVSYGSSQEVLRLRIEVINHSTAPSHCGECPYVNYPISMEDSLQYSTDPANGSSWKNIGFNANLPFILSGSNDYVVQDEPTTSQLSGTSDPFSPGTMMVTDSTTNETMVPSPGRTEHEWVLKGTPSLKPNTTYYFRENQQYYWYRPYPDMSYNSYPSLTTTATLAIQLNSFTVTNEGQRIKLQWSASPDQKDAYTNIQRSTDQQAWVIINRINSSGRNYTEYDNSPPAGSTLYYRLQQYDKNGSYSFSETRSVKTSAPGKAVVLVIPNPATTAINFKVEHTDVRYVTAVLTDMSGRALFTQAFKNLQTGMLNRMNLRQNLAPGLYILKLTGDGFAESTRVMVK